ncbi:MAG: hypothetical protein ABWY37_10400 [Microbacterium pygmaeum]|uniref:Uncharacterized protein n=1 Tax=Microbacterium pygmaeum TaxID=370764 RepID=A0A1G7ZQN8_9MICO|nr:hypothetical protein [Microbacterium pygmaeum]SDH10857.1 hypothetical protein SAMN04489810_2130 [Microbacterium pygmaeum]
MESESQMGPTRYRIYMILGLVLSLALVGVGIWGIVGSNEPVLGWVMLIAGIAITVLSIVQLRRA